MSIRDRRVQLAVAVLFVLGLAGFWGAGRLRAWHHSRAAEQTLESRDFTRAADHLQKYLDLFPEDLASRLLLAQVSRQQGDHDQALQHLAAYQRKGGAAEVVVREQARLLAQQGDLAEALRLLSWCQDHPEAPETPLDLEAGIEGSLKALMPAYLGGFTFAGSEAAQQVQQTRQAADLWLRLRTGRADQVQGLVWRARAHSFAHEQPQALADVRQALALDPDHFEAQVHLAMFLTQESPADAAQK